MTDTTTNDKPAKREAIAIRDWIDEKGNPVNSGDEKAAVGFRYIHLPSAKKAMPAFNPETDSPPQGSFFDYVCGDAGHASTMLAIFGGLTLAGNVVNSATNGPKGDPNLNPISLVEDRFKEIDGGVWADRAAGVGGIRYDKEKLAAAIADAKGEKDPAPYLVKMENKVDPKSGAVVAADTKGAISWGSYALRNAAVKAAYDKLTGGGVSLESL
jgi:hypothetical protein